MEKHKNHITPVSTYLKVGGALLALTGITVAVSFVHLGPFNLVVALLIAGVKASLVGLFFMHLLYDNKLFATIFSISLLFVSVFIILILFDTLTRDAIYEQKAQPIKATQLIEKPN